jgi:excisionase family DNA binding protein
MGIDRTRFLTVKQAAERSGYSYEHLRKLVKSGAIEIFPIDERKYLIDWESLEHYQEGRKNRRPHST